MDAYEIAHAGYGYNVHIITIEIINRKTVMTEYENGMTEASDGITESRIPLVMVDRISCLDYIIMQQLSMLAFGRVRAMCTPDLL